MFSNNLFLSVFILITANSSFALQAMTVKGDRALFSLDSSEIGILSDNTIAVSTDKVTQIKLLQVRGNRALGQTVRGTIKPNMIFKSVITKSDTKNYSAGLESLQWGLLGGLSFNTMTIPINSISLKLQGTGFGLMGLVDYRVLSNLVLRGFFGYETFKASVASTTCASGNCSVNLNYFSGHGLVQYDLTKFNDNSRYWIGLGGGFLLLSSGSSEIINTSSMNTNQIFILATGFDYQLTKVNSLPVQVDYFIYPDGSIKTQQVNLRIGYKF